MPTTKSIYLDYAAATPLDEMIEKAMRPFYSQQFYNPSANYQAAVEVNQAVESARKSVASQLACRPSQIIFCAGGSEANNLAIQGTMLAFQREKNTNILISGIEHPSVSKPAKQYKNHTVKVTADGLIDLIDLEAKISDQTLLVSIIYANHEIGTVQQLRKIADIIQKVRIDRQRRSVKLPLIFHTDACQAANYLSLQVNKLGLDLMTINGAKMYGPKQSAVLFVRRPEWIKGQILGGGQELDLRSGTLNPAAIVGIAKALEQSQKLRQIESKRLSDLQRWLAVELLKIEGITINGSMEHRLPNNLHFTWDGFDNERLTFELDNRGIMVATGSACSASNQTPSEVLMAIGLSPVAARSSIRLSFGRQTTLNQLKRFISVLKQLVNDPKK